MQFRSFIKYLGALAPTASPGCSNFFSDGVVHIGRLTGTVYLLFLVASMDTDGEVGGLSIPMSELRQVKQCKDTARARFASSV